jgi:hypothetical protein
MRSLWRILALQWLGGEGSDALTGETIVRDMLLFGEHTRVLQTFNVTRRSGVSHQAMMSPDSERRAAAEIVGEG